jgi:hypothetical protein
MQRILAILAFLVSGLGSVTVSHSHALQPGYLELRLINKDVYAVFWKVPAVGGWRSAHGNRRRTSKELQSPNAKPTHLGRRSVRGALDRKMPGRP